VTDPPPLGDDALACYDTSVEADRLATRLLEFERTKGLVADPRDVPARRTRRRVPRPLSEVEFRLVAEHRRL